MENHESNNEYFDEDQSLRVIRQMIEVSHKRIRNDGILFIVWGWISLITYLLGYLTTEIIHTYQVTLIKRWIMVLLPVAGIIYTVFYLYRRSRKAVTYISISLRYVWISLFLGMVLINLIQGNVLHKIVFELQHPIFMVLIAIAIVVTGGILRYKMIIAGGIIFGLLAFASSYLPLTQQMLLEAIAWVIAFIIPGHILYAKRNRR
jgi:uncharacterized membrane protein